MQVRALKACVVTGGRLAKGEVADISRDDALTLISFGQVEAYSGPSEVRETVEVHVETPEDAPVPRKKRKKKKRLE